MKVKAITECGRDYMPDEGGMVAGWQRQNVPAEQYVAECIAYGQRLTADGVYGTLYTLGALDNPQSPINQAPFNVDSIVRQLLDAGILDGNLGPHLHATNGNDVKHWISNARVVKALDNKYPLTIARDDAIRYFRVTMDDLNAQSDAREIASRLINKLEGYRHDLLYCEGLVGVSPQDVVAHSKQLRDLQQELSLSQIKIAGPSWYDGNGDAALMDSFMFCDSAVTQCYWANAGFTKWHALRYQDIFKNVNGGPVQPGELEAYAADIWRRYNIPLNPNSALYKYWFDQMKNGNFLGFPMEQEHPWTQQNNKYMVQGFSSTILTYTIATGAITEGLPPL